MGQWMATDQLMRCYLYFRFIAACFSIGLIFFVYCGARATDEGCHSKGCDMI